VTIKASGAFAPRQPTGHFASAPTARTHPVHLGVASADQHLSRELRRDPNHSAPQDSACVGRVSPHHAALPQIPATGQQGELMKHRNAVLIAALIPNVLLGGEALTTSYRPPSPTPSPYAEVAAVAPGPELQPLALGSTIQLNTGGVASGVLPIIDASGSLGTGALIGDFKLSLKPEPPSGDTKAVSQAIRIDSGTFSANLGGLWRHSFTNNPADQPFLIDVRCAAQFSYQRARPATADASRSSTSTLTEFGIVSPEIRLGLWLKYFYIGYKYAYTRTFGTTSELSDDLDRTAAHKFLMVAKLAALSGTADGDKNKNPFFIECQYTGGKNSVNGGSFSLLLTKAFDNW
jgi:hypothetical protein